MRGGDEIIKQQVEYKDPGRAGENVIWNFSKLNAVNPEYKLSYYPAPLIKDSIYIMGKDTILKKEVQPEDLIIGVEHRTMYYYRIKNDTLYNLGHENPVTLMHHKRPLVINTYPFDYKQQLSKSYSSEGLYSSQEPMKTKGNVQVASDAYGMMILPSGDTLNHVLRIKAIQTIEEVDSIKAVDDNPLNMTVESYRWYVKGYRYPVFEAIRSFDTDTTKTEGFNVAFFYPPQEHYYLWDDAENMAIIDSLWNEKQKPNITDPTNPNNGMNQADSFNYNFYPNPVKDNLYVEYLLEKDTEVSVGIFNMGGRLVDRLPIKHQKKGFYSETISMTDYPVGNYILQIEVNKQIINQKISKK